MRFELTRMDEWPRHQTGATFDVVDNPSPHWSDGYYFTCGDEDGEVALFSGLRLYPNTDVLDAFTCVSTRQRQHNMRFSRRLRPRIDDLEVGAMSVEIVEGLRTLVTRAAPNPYGIEYELRWQGVTEPYNEDHIVSYVGGRLSHLRSNYDQACDVTGWVAVDGRRWEVSSPRWVGVRDHSWGIGQTGGPPARGIAPPTVAAKPYGLRQWCVARFPTRVVFWQFHHSSDGEYTKFETQVLYPWGDERRPWSYRSMRHDLEFVPGHRRLRQGTIELERPDGGWDRFAIEVVSDPVYMLGGGYWRGFDDGFGRGAYRGEEHHEGEVWDVSHPTRIGDPKGVVRERPDAWAEAWGRFRNLDDPSEAGSGHLECVVMGDYPGFD